MKKQFKSIIGIRKSDYTDKIINEYDSFEEALKEVNKAIEDESNIYTYANIFKDDKLMASVRIRFR